jgi:hypothetical protein
VIATNFEVREIFLGNRAISPKETLGRAIRASHFGQEPTLNWLS